MSQIPGDRVMERSQFLWNFLSAALSNFIFIRKRGSRQSLIGCFQREHVYQAHFTPSSILEKDLPRRILFKSALVVTSHNLEASNTQ